MNPAVAKISSGISFSVEEYTSLRRTIVELEKENAELRDFCRGLSQAQEGLEMVLGETNRKLLEGEMLAMELGRVFSVASDATCVVRDDHLVVRANDAMLRFLNKSEDEVIGREISGLLKGILNRKFIVQFMAMLEKGVALENDMERRCSAGKTEHFVVSTLPLVTIDGSPGAVARFQNITSRKCAELALEKANNELERLACIDGLTQLFNRRCFDDNLDREWKRMFRDGKSLSLVLCDIDFFKRYNDFYGHQEGDDCLCQVAKALGACVKRPADLAARYGGEEFVLLLPDTPVEGAIVLAEKVRREVETLGLPHAASEIAPVVTLSLGVASLMPSSGKTAKELVRAADEALYLAKQQGRNRFVCA
ncbi:MAG: diguanylate cyclase [Deltaproteobacteria bacterium]|nr:diguanylate cyclase [Deltaproteobacteria bacterium]